MQTISETEFISETELNRRKKIGIAQKNKVVSEETREILRKLNSGENNPQFGKHPSKETLEKKRIAALGIKNPNFGKKYLPGKHPCCGKPKPELTRKKIAATLKKVYLVKENHPRWLGGISFYPYCEKFTKAFRERVRAFFGYTCQVCGYIWQPGEKKLAVHHVNYRKDSCCDQTIKPYFVPVCSNTEKRGCHGKTNSSRDFWKQFFTELIETRYQGKCYFTEDEMLQQGGLALC
jgi:rubrerythrin